MTVPSDPEETGGDQEPDPGDPSPPSPPGRSRYWRPPASPTGAGRVVTVALAGTVGVLAVLIGTSISLVINRDRWTDSSSSEPVPFVIGWLAGVGFAVVGMGLLTGVTWMVWQHRAHTNRAAMADDALKPATVWWWLVPVASIVMPFLAIRDLASGEHDRPRLRGWWWATYLLFGILSALATVLPVYFAEGDWQEWLAMFGYGVGIVAALLAMRVVKVVNIALESRRQARGWPPGWREVSGRAQVLFAVGGAALASVGALFVGLIFPRLLEEVARTDTQTASGNDFAVGTCFDDTEGYPEMPCDGPHDAEVYARLAYPDQAVYPGSGAFESWAEPVCYARFEGYTGIRYEESSLDFGYLYPGGEGWAGGDREVICYLFDPSGDLTGPVGTGTGTA
jgi:hypothetical protein